MRREFGSITVLIGFLCCNGSLLSPLLFHANSSPPAVAATALTWFQCWRNKRNNHAKLASKRLNNALFASQITGHSVLTCQHGWCHCIVLLSDHNTSQCHS
jgi:hypothetical protein